MSQPQGTEAKARTVRWWHFLHRWSQWQEPYRHGGLTSAFGNGAHLRQQRSCQRCNLVQDRLCEVDL